MPREYPLLLWLILLSWNGGSTDIAGASEKPGFPRLVDVSPVLPGEPLPAGWENVTQKLWQTIPGYEHDQKWWNRRVGTIHVDNTNGDLFVMVCSKWGTWRSTDQGETWTLANATALGRQVENRGVCSNPLSGDFVLFKVHGGPPTQSAVVLNHGKEWLPVTSNIGDGFRCGMADWEHCPPKNLLAIRHHHDGLYLSEDSGASWTELPRNAGYGAAMLGPDRIFLAFLQNGDDDVPKWRAKDMIKEIMLTRDRCKTFTKVAEFTPRSETPARYGHDLYWIAAEGVMVTRDRGLSWEIMGRPIHDLLYGPFFGAGAEAMMVVTSDGFFKTTDAGQHWTKVADLLIPDGQRIECAHPGWDPIHNVVYIGFLGDDVYRHHPTVSAGAESKPTDSAAERN
jgi:photosystem II stability/assembly factor-like uncharacterized protein